MSATIALLDTQTSPFPAYEKEPWGAEVEAVDAYELPRTDLGRFVGLVIQGMVDQELFYRQRGLIRSFLDEGKVVVWSGQLFRPWLPGCGILVPATIRSYHDYTVHIVTPHPVFDGVDPTDLTYRRGVAGFFARGHHPLPEGAEVILALAGGEPIVYVDRTTTAGTILSHAGTGLLGWADSTSTAARINAQVLAWIRDEAGRS